MTGFGKFGLKTCFGGWGFGKKLKFGEAKQVLRPNFPKTVTSGGVFALECEKLHFFCRGTFGAFHFGLKNVVFENPAGIKK